jgi:hypothetical protein
MLDFTASNSLSVNVVLGVAFAISSRLFIQGYIFCAISNALDSIHGMVLRSSTNPIAALVASLDAICDVDCASNESLIVLLCLEYSIRSFIILVLSHLNHLFISQLPNSAADLGALPHSSIIWFLR